MRSFLLCCCCGCLFVLLTCISRAATAVAAKEESVVRLRVSVRRDILKRVPSCQHTFSQVELLNLHSTEPIVIHAIQTAPEETILVGGNGEAWDDDAIPQQLHVSRLPSGSLTLGPGQVAIVPLTFLPRYPQLPIESEKPLDDWRPPPLRMSATARADLANMVGREILEQADRNREVTRKRNNLEPPIYPENSEFEVSTSIIVDTSRGAVKLPIVASSIRSNPFGLPDVIYFNSIEQLAAEESDEANVASNGGVLIVDSEVGVTSLSPEKSRGPNEQRQCYDLYLTNPSSIGRDMEVQEVLISRPEAMSVELDSSLTPQDFRSTTPSQVIRDWSDDGPHIVPSGEQAYIATVCTAPDGVKRDESSGIYVEEMTNWIDSGNPDRSLGYLQVRTDTETFFIGLELYLEQQSTQVGGNTHDGSLPGDEDFPILEQDTAIDMVDADPVLQGIPASLHFSVLTRANPSSTISIGIKNTSPQPLKIMRVTVGMDTGPEGITQLGKEVGLGIRVTVGNSVAGTSEAGFSVLKSTQVIPAGETVEDALIFSCSIATDRDVLATIEQESLVFTGAVLVRASPRVHLGYFQWREDIRTDPYKDSQYALEIPYSITIVNGRVELLLEETSHLLPQLGLDKKINQTHSSVSALFFPLRQQSVVLRNHDQSNTAVFDDSGVRLRLRIVSNLPVPFSLAGADVNEKPVYTSMTQSASHKETNGVCGRFDVSMSQESIEEWPSQSSTDFVEVGSVSLQYNIPELDLKDIESSLLFPKTCYLTIRTSPVDAGVHQLPLIVYPGHLETHPGVEESQRDVPTAADAMELSCEESDFPSAVMIVDRLLAWFRASTVGLAFQDLLASIVDSEGRRNGQENVLGSYFCGLCKSSLARNNTFLRPIVVRAGAIEHGSLLTTNLYLTNHNPVPLTVYTDVGEVEGMNINLAREQTRGRGDGNHMFDYLPKLSVEHNESAEDLVFPRGVWRKHPVIGLRQFLLTNEASAAFASSFPYRGAVSPSDVAFRSQPVLEHLYKKYSFVEFYKEPLPAHLKPQAPSLCDQDSHPPLYNFTDNTTIKNDFAGPLLFSGDDNSIRSLSVCWRKENDKTRGLFGGSTITIPPGGVARFDVRVRAPSKSSLSSDITPVVATGLVLSTNHGEVMPLVMTFEALQGQLDVSHSPSSSADDDLAESETPGKEDVEVIMAPVGLFQDAQLPNSAPETKSLTIPPSKTRPESPRMLDYDAHADTSSVPLFVKSSFTREVRLRGIDSCNPWFAVDLQASNETYVVDGDTWLRVGSIRSVVNCSSTDASSFDSSRFASFYQCALNWLEQRSELQPRGCGVLPRPIERVAVADEDIDAEHSHVNRAVRAFRRALHVLKKIYGQEAESGGETRISSLPSRGSHHIRGGEVVKSGSQRGDGYVAPLILDVFAETWDVWRTAAGMGLRTVGSSLEAQIEFDTSQTIERPNSLGLQHIDPESSEAVAKHNLTVTMHNVAAETLLAAPKLVDCTRAKTGAKLFEPEDVDDVSVIEFPPTLVAAVTSLTLPLRNPTSVPVKVRLAVGPRKTSLVAAPENQPEGTTDSVQSRFVQNYDAPYVQNGQTDNSRNMFIQRLWWDGGGAFVLADDRGDIIRSHHNVTLRAGPGAYVSTVNPSLHSNSAFIVGCGTRCGIRDDAKTEDPTVDPTEGSPIGASSAVGSALVGRKRSQQPLLSTAETETSLIAAGGSPMVGNLGPAAFALPYSSLDEIIIPPFGEAEIGPIFFRPPGRFSSLGCEAVTESKKLEKGSAKKCGTKSFEALVFLENSLTGLERVIFRGTGMWERVLFLDPEPQGSDAFGDIELRNGLPSLMFPGSLHGLPQSDRKQPVVKEVVVHNAGDVAVTFSAVYFSDTIRLPGKRFPKDAQIDPCEFGRFRLASCGELSDFSVVSEETNTPEAWRGFALSPGENRSLFIEHRPDCSKREEFISLNLQIRRDEHSVATANEGALPLFSGSGEFRRSKSNSWQKSFGRQKIDLLIGYQLSEQEFAACIPFVQDSSDGGISHRAIGLLKQNHSIRADSMPTLKRPGVGRWKKIVEFLFFLLLSVGAGLRLLQSFLVRSQAAKQFRSVLQGPHSDLRSSAKSPRSNWPSAFRCLAHADPSSSELQSISRTHVRQVILSHYKRLGAFPPQCFGPAGVLLRDRSGTANNAQRQSSSKEGAVTSNERIRTISDSIFQDVSTTGCGNCKLPCGFGWRTAFSRGLISAAALNTIPLQLKTSDLISRRSKDRSVTDTEQPDEDSSNGQLSGAEVGSAFGRANNENVPEVKVSVAVTTRAPKESSGASGGIISTSDSEVTVPEKEASPTREDADVLQDPDTDKIAKKENEETVSASTSFVQVKNGGDEMPFQTKEHGSNWVGKNRRTSQRATQSSSSPAKGGPRKEAESKGRGPEEQNDSKPSVGKAKTNNRRDKTRPTSQSTRKDELGPGTGHSSTESGTAAPSQKPAAKTERATRASPRDSSTKATRSTRKVQPLLSSPQPEKQTLQPSSSPGSQKSHSSQSDASGGDTSSRNAKHSESTFRPPPGLAPPPGFSQGIPDRGMPRDTFSLPSTPSLIESQVADHAAFADAKTEFGQPQNSGKPLSSPVPGTPLSYSSAAARQLHSTSFSATVQAIPNMAVRESSASPKDPDNDVHVASSPAGAIGTLFSPAGKGTSDGELTGLTPAIPPAEQAVSGKPLLSEGKSGAMSDFDVLDFLDSILNDGSASGDNTNSADPSSSSLPSDPWATERQSRAAAYGISFEQQVPETEASPILRAMMAGSPQRGSGTYTGTAIPLLTPAALLSSSSHDGDEELDNGSDFYMSLLEE